MQFPYPAGAGVPVGTIIAYAGQVEPSSTSPNQVVSCAEPEGPRVGTAAHDAAHDAARTGRAADAGQPSALIEAQGWMVCDGRSLDVAAYPALFGVLGTLYGQGDRGAGTFKIPDCRGLFLRGVDSGSGMDPDAAQRTAPDGSGTTAGVGSVQCDAVIDHVHSYRAAPVPNAAGSTGSSATTPSQPTGTGPPAEPNSISIARPDGTKVRTSTETRPRNLAVWYLIKWR